MRKSRYSFQLEITLPALITIIIIMGVYISFLTHDPHWLNRAGALLAAIAASFILVQISTEIRLEHEKGAVDNDIRKADENNEAVTLCDELKDQLIKKKLQKKRSQILGDRLQVAMFVVVAAMIGEVLHGFGDLIMCYGFGVCAGH